MFSVNNNRKDNELDEIVRKFRKDISERQTKVNPSEYKFFNVFLKCLIRNNLSKLDKFVLSISDK